MRGLLVALGMLFAGAAVAADTFALSPTPRPRVASVQGVNYVKLAWTNPSAVQDTGHCDGTQPTSDLATIRIHAQRFDGPDSVVLEISELGREALDDSATVAVQAEGEVEFWTTSLDTLNNESCRSNRLFVDLPPVSVPVWIPGNARTVRWYDVQGRLLAEEPKLPGVYVRREGVMVRRLRIVR